MHILSINASSGKTYAGFLGWWTSGTSDKLHGPLFFIEAVYLLLKKNLSLRHQNAPLLYIKHTECDMEYRAKLKVLKKIVDEFRRKNIAWRLFVENYFH